MKKSIFIVFAIVCTFTFTSCSSSRYIVSERLNEPYYQRPIQPGTDYVWVDGEWNWRHRHYEHQRGFWAAPRNNRHWVAGQWLASGRGWKWQHGNWSN